MGPRLRSLLTLLVLGLLLLVAAVWGWAALTEPLPEKAEPPVCVERSFEAGDRVSRGDVTVSVWNASDRNGLAGLTMELLTDAGFAPGDEGDAPKDARVGRAQIWTELPRRHPAVRLVAGQLGDVRVVRRETDAAGVLVVVGSGFQELTRGPRAVKVSRAVEVCGPPAPA